MDKYTVTIKTANGIKHLFVRAISEQDAKEKLKDQIPYYYASVTVHKA